jgi:hypothetical protein
MPHPMIGRIAASAIFVLIAVLLVWRRSRR